jgi:predicted hotdog family 3-hydroxylacyl-ACP dehydratase
MFNREQILRMIPHSGSMCLLDEVLSWDEASLRCLSRRYRGKDNPMRRANGELGTACGIEIAGQAAAVHGRLLAEPEGEPARGYLVSLRDVQLRSGCLDAIHGDLVVDAVRLAGDANSAIYHFALAVHGIELASGRFTVLLNAAQEDLEPRGQTKVLVPPPERSKI